MWLVSTRILFVTLAFLAAAEHAEAQVQGATTSASALPAPSDATLNTNNAAQTVGSGSATNNNGALYSQQLTPAPRVQPLLTPSDQNVLARTGSLSAQTTGGDVNVTGITAGGTGAQSPTNTLSTVGNNISAGAANTAGAVAGGAQNVASGAAAGATQTTGIIANNAAAGAGAVLDGTANAVGAVADAVTPDARASTTSGFSPSLSGASLPLNSGQMPVTNVGMNMNIDSNMVGGSTQFDPNLPPSPSNAVPYEVQLEQRNREIQEKARAMAFEQAKKSMMPMETYEIRDVLGRLKDTQEAIQTPVRAAPKPENVIQTVSTDPAATPQTIQLAAGNVTTMNIVDITGEPWPIVDIGFGGPFDVKPPEPGGHIIRITPLKDFAHGNMVIRLLKLTTPLTFTLQAGGDVVNYRFDARIPENGPNAKQPIISGGIKTAAGDKITTSFLEGATPAGAEKLTVDGVDGRTNAYRFGGTLYVRTPLSLLSPAWQSSATSADGMNVYVLSEAPPVVLLSDHGTLVRARIGEVKQASNGF